MSGIIGLRNSADKNGMRKYIYASFFMMTTACAPQFHSAVQNIASNTGQDIACKSQKLETHLWDGLKTYLLEQKEIPSSEEVKNAMHAQIAQLAQENPGLTKNDVANLNQNLDSLIESLLQEAPTGERVETSQQMLGLLSAIDVGDRSTTFRSYIQDRVRGNFAKLTQTVQSYDLNCQTPEVTTPTSDSSTNTVQTTPLSDDYEHQKTQALSAGIAPAVFGERWAFATAYQSCQSLETKALTAQTPFIQGIVITGKHPDGIGNKRMIGSLPEVQATHPYIVSSYGSSCFSVRDNPLIYDYG
ncbi:MAG TPA: hypothetical protein VN132_16215, partial [Bdellovibrio sp.]|nr:hypothetical protein [Bdellovibrio sp.]